jgi:hypothetical protein
MYSLSEISRVHLDLFGLPVGIVTAAIERSGKKASRVRPDPSKGLHGSNYGPVTERRHFGNSSG